MEKAIDTEGLRDRLLLHATDGPETERPRSGLRDARRADVVQSADRLLLRDRCGWIELAQACGRSALLQHLVQRPRPGTECPRLRRARRDRQPDRQDRLEEGISNRASERRDGHGWWTAVSSVGRRQPRGVRREDRQQVVAVSNTCR